MQSCTGVNKTDSVTMLSRYDYLEFTDVAGNKTRFDYKVNTDKWPLTKVFSPGPRLYFLFHSDSSNNEWGYKFRVPTYCLSYIVGICAAYSFDSQTTTTTSV